MRKTTFSLIWITLIQSVALTLSSICSLLMEPEMELGIRLLLQWWYLSRNNGITEIHIVLFQDLDIVLTIINYISLTGEATIQCYNCLLNCNDPFSSTGVATCNGTVCKKTKTSVLGKFSITAIIAMQWGKHYTTKINHFKHDICTF